MRPDRWPLDVFLNILAVRAFEPVKVLTEGMEPDFPPLLQRPDISTVISMGELNQKSQAR